MNRRSTIIESMKCKKKTITIFDLDDTLVFTEAKIRVIDSLTGKECRALTPAQFNVFEKDSTSVLNFDDFEDSAILRKGRMNRPIFSILQKLYAEGKEISIITARSSKKIVYDFFLSRGVKLKMSMIFAVNDPRSIFMGHVYERKKQAVEKLIEKGFNDITFYDDYIHNLTSVKELENENSGVFVEAIHVTKEKYAKTSSKEIG